MIPRPGEGDHAAFFQGYVDLVPDGDVLVQLEDQALRVQGMLRMTSEEQGGYRYAEGKWTVKQVVQHLIDGERLFCYRALCIARGDQQSLPGFDENAYAELDGSAGRTMVGLAEEHAAVRAATLALYRGLDAAAIRRRGIANGTPVTVAALAWITAGHELHHLGVLQDRYGLEFAPGTP